MILFPICYNMKIDNYNEKGKLQVAFINILKYNNITTS